VFVFWISSAYSLVYAARAGAGMQLKFSAIAISISNPTATKKTTGVCGWLFARVPQ
jgi:hypothetical protein